MYSTYGNYATQTTSTDPSAIIGGILAGLGIMLFIGLAIAVVCLIANYKVFKKMGLDGWKSLIPMVNTYLMLDKVGISQKWLLVLCYGSIVSIIPIIGSLALMVAVIYFAVLQCVSLAKSFDKSTGFAVGLFFLYPIFLCILAFSDAKYVGAKPMNDIIFKNNK
ncbi:MAG: hypothetical protein IJ097_00330 [Bacilli bacterium]|nr:hypothetical protein [Bacilli bacterium]